MQDAAQKPRLVVRLLRGLDRDVDVGLGPDGDLGGELAVDWAMVSAATWDSELDVGKTHLG